MCRDNCYEDDNYHDGEEYPRYVEDDVMAENQIKKMREKRMKRGGTTRSSKK